MSFERTGSEKLWEGKIITVGRERFRHDDGEEVTREKVWHPGAVGILPVDDTHVWLTRQPREVIGAVDSLEIPAGKLDVEGEPPLQTGRRELAEEIGKAADDWAPILDYVTSIGVMDEVVHLFHATALHDASDATPDPHERIEVIAWPLDDLDGALAATIDAKTLIGLMWLRDRRLAAQPLADDVA